MNRIILQLVAVGFCFAIGQALQCYKCDIGLWNLCLTTKITCDAGQQCYSGEGKAGGHLPIKMKGCLRPEDCNTIKQETFSNATIYSVNRTCCNTDLCNVAPGLPGTSSLSLAIATISALYVANVLG